MRTELRYAHHPEDVRNYDTVRLRKEFIIEKLFSPGEVYLTYSMYDRYVTGGAMPTDKPLELKTFDAIKTAGFLDRREMGIFNIGGKGRVKAGSDIFELNYKEALYLGRSGRKIIFESPDPENPALFYFNSAPAHTTFKDKKIDPSGSDRSELGKSQFSNVRHLNKMIAGKIVETCQLQMGMTEIVEGSVWNTMPAHTHERRTEVYFYFDIPENQAICHLMGEPDQTRHLWITNKQAVISPPWSIHSAAGTSNYAFIWGMAGENIDFADMEIVGPDQLR